MGDTDKAKRGKSIDERCTCPCCTKQDGRFNYPRSKRKPSTLGDAYSARELEVIAHLLKGSSTPEIAKEIGIVQSAVKYHITSIFRKSGVKKRTEFILKYWTGSVVSDYNLPGSKSE